MASARATEASNIAIVLASDFSRIHRRGTILPLLRSLQSTFSPMHCHYSAAPRHTNQFAGSKLSINIEEPSIAPAEQLALPLTAEKRKLCGEHTAINVQLKLTASSVTTQFAHESTNHQCACGAAVFGKTGKKDHRTVAVRPFDHLTDHVASDVTKSI